MSSALGGKDAAVGFKNFDEQLFDVFSDTDQENVSVSKILAELRRAGLRKNDPRLKETMRNLSRAEEQQYHHHQQQQQQRPGGGEKGRRELLLDRATFSQCIRDNIVLIKKAMTGDLVLPEFQTFCKTLDDVYDVCRANTAGKVGDYIPQLARFSPDNWGMAVCSVHGQRYSKGAVDTPFSIQSASKPISYALAISELGEEHVHRYVGHEPSGESFNTIKLGHGNKPHNPMINAGAIVTASLLKNQLPLADRFEYAFSQFKKIAGNDPLGFNNSIFLSERETADRNYALAYYMRENKCFPEGNDLKETLDFYFMLCSLEITCESGAVIAASLANGGICPVTGENVLDPIAVRNTLSLMHSCGMYDYSGEFAFKVGLPGKSGVSGVILLVIPNVCGFCLWSPALDKHGNSMRGIQFCEGLVQAFNFHHYDNLQHTPQKSDPRVTQLETQGSKVVQLLFGAYNGDLTALTRMALVGENMSLADYDGRTALHLAAAEGHVECVRFLLEKCDVSSCVTDRWGQTPLDDAKRFERNNVVKYLSNDTTPS